MKNPYRLRWEPKFFVRAIIFGVVFLAFQLVLNYLNSDKIKELNSDKAGNGKYIANRITKHFTPIALCVVFSYFVMQIATGTPHYKEIMFAAMVLCVSAVINILTKEKK